MADRKQTFRDFDPVEPVEVPDHLRQTLLRKFDECPRSAYLYLKYDGGSSSHALDRGSMFHYFAETATKLMIEEGEESMPPDMAKELMTTLIAERTDLVVPISEQDGLRVMAYHWAEGSRNLIEPNKVIAVESPLELTIAGWRVTGTVDLAKSDGPVLEVHDYKSSFKMPDKQAMKKFQTSLYALAVIDGGIVEIPFKLDHIQLIVLAEVYPRYLWEDELAYRDAIVSRETILDHRVALEALVQRFEKAFETWDFPARVGSHCSECPCQADCPIPAQLRTKSFIPTDTEITTPEQAAEVAERRYLMAQQMDRDWEALKAYAADNAELGPIHYSKHGIPYYGVIRYGRDQILEWGPSNSERLKSKVKLQEAVHNAVTFGAPFDIADHYTISQGTTLKKRTLNEHELAAEAGIDTSPSDDPEAEDED